MTSGETEIDTNQATAYGVDDTTENEAQGFFKPDNTHVRQNETGVTGMIQRHEYPASSYESKPISPSSSSHPEQAPAAIANVGPIESSSGKLESREDGQ